jgi:hypothetical protein
MGFVVAGRGFGGCAGGAVFVAGRQEAERCWEPAGCHLANRGQRQGLQDLVLQGAVRKGGR